MFDLLLRSTLAMLCLRHPDRKPGDISIIFRVDLPNLPQEAPTSVAERCWPLPKDVKYRASVRLGAGAWGASEVHASPEAALAAVHASCLADLQAAEGARKAVTASAIRAAEFAKGVMGAGGDAVDVTLNQVLKNASYGTQE